MADLPSTQDPSGRRRRTCLAACLLLTTTCIGAPARAEERLLRAFDFLETIGVNVHVAYTDGDYADIRGVIANLKYLGITHVRDVSLHPRNQGQASYGIAARAGIRFNLFVQGGNVAEAVSRLNAFARAHPGAVASIEGPNEVNNWPVTHDGQKGAAGAAAFQLALFAAVKADPLLKEIPVYNLTSWPDIAGQADFANYHAYPFRGDQPYATLAKGFALQAAVMPGKPMVLTEAGYYTLPQSTQWGGVDHATQAKLTLNLLMDAARLGVKRTFLYQLLDAYPDPEGAVIDKHFGLFDIDSRPKPTATALRNLTTILADPGTEAAKFRAGSLPYSVQGSLSGGGSVLLQKSSGEHLLIVWNEPDLWDQASRRPITPPAENVVIDFGMPQPVLRVYDPIAGAEPVETLAEASRVRLSLTGHPLIIEVGPARERP